MNIFRLGLLGQRELLEIEAIQTVCDRLQHATMPADRRSAVLGLKSFSRQFRELVIQYGLRALLLTLRKDIEDDIMVKALLEMLIILFLKVQSTEDLTLGWISNQSRVQNGKYPSPVLMEEVEPDSFSMWIADEITATDENIRALVDVLLTVQDPSTKMYALQLLEALVSTRMTLTKEALINIPLAMSTIVSLLNENYEPVRNETILLLMALVNHNFNIQKLVAFENTFDRLFEIIQEEGGIRGSILVQDCLTLITNLLLYNASNQKFFLETDCVPKLASLIAEPVSDLDGVDQILWTGQRMQNLIIALEICKTFVEPNNQQLTENQMKLFKSGIFFSIMRIIFSPLIENPVRRTALQVIGDIIAGNPELQYQFLQVDVPYLDPSLPKQIQNFERPVPAPVALLNWALLTNSVHIFDTRLASVYCLKCFFKENKDSRAAFLLDQIKANENPSYYEEIADGIERKDESNDENEKSEDSAGSAQQLAESLQPLNAAKTPYANLFKTLMDFDSNSKLNPYLVWFAAVLLIYLFEDSPENCKLAQEVKIGNASEGEEVMSSIQAMGEILVSQLETSDPRIAVGYLMLLSVWLYEDSTAVDFFLVDPSTFKSLLAFISKNSTESSSTVLGMSAILAGVTYEFSTSDSPISRVELHSLLIKSLGADNYSQKVKQFKDSEEFKNFDDSCTFDVSKDDTGLPKVFFVSEYLDLVKDNFYRIRRTLHRDPMIETRPRLSFEAYEELEAKHVNIVKEFEDFRSSATKAELSLSESLTHTQNALDAATKAHTELATEMAAQQEAQSNFNSRIEELQGKAIKLEEEHKELESLYKNQSLEVSNLTKQRKIDEAALTHANKKLADVEAAKTKAEEGINKMSRELFQLTKQKSELDGTVQKLEKELASCRKQLEDLKKESARLIDELRRANDDLIKKDSPSSGQGEQQRVTALQVELEESRQSNANLMEKLRSAANVVQDLRKANEEQSEELALLRHKSSQQDLSEEKFIAIQKELEAMADMKASLETKLAIVETSDLKRLDKPEAETQELAHLSKENILLRQEIETLKSALDEGSTSTLTKDTSDFKSDLSEQYQQLKANHEKLLQSQKDLETKEMKLHEKLEELVKTISSRDAEITKLKDELEDVEFQLSEKELDLTASKARIETLEHQLELLSERAKELNSNYKSKVSDLEERTAEAESTLKKKEAELKQVEADCEKQLADQNKALALEILKVEENFTLIFDKQENEHTLEIEEQYSAHNEEFLKLKDEHELEIKALQQERESLRSKIENLQKQNQGMEAELSELQKAQDALEAEVANAEENKNFAEARLTEAEAELASSRAQVAEVVLCLEDSEKEVLRLKENVSKELEQSSITETAKVAVTAEQDTLQAAEEVRTLHLKIEELESALNSTKQELSEAVPKCDVKRLEEELSRAQKDKTRNGAATDLNKSAESGEVVDLNEDASNPTPFNEENEGRLEKLQSEIEEIDRQNCQLKEDLQRSRQELELALASLETEKCSRELAERQEKKEDADDALQVLQLQAQVEVLTLEVTEKARVQADYDDLVYLWAEQEEKLAEYKKRLGELQVDTVDVK